ncbi:MAG: TolC family outer membrane protein [Gallionellaceae bacterium]|nr:TolC family outer membrane protein [Gallionellaceae bacterium]
MYPHTRLIISGKAFLLTLATLSTALSANATDLLAIYHAAQGQDAVFAGAQAAQRAGQEKLPQGRSSLLPSVSLKADSTYNDNSIQYQSIPPVTSNSQYNSHGYSVNLVQPLFRQQNWLSYTEAQLQVAQTDAQFKSAQQDLILRVAQAYFDVLMAQDSVQLTQTQKTAIAEQLEQAKRNFEVGSATITDTHEAQARYDLVVSQEIAAQSNLQIKKSALQQLTNTVPGPLQALNPQFKPETVQLPELAQLVDMEKWVDAAQHSNLQLAVAQAAAELADKEVARNRGGHYPTLDIVASYSQSYGNTSSLGVRNDNLASSVGVQLNMPLYQGGATNSKWREAQANRDRAQAELENIRRTIALQTRQAYLGVVNGIAQVQALQQAMTSGQSLLEASKLGQEVGVRTNLDVLNAQQQLYSTQRDLYQAEYNYLLSQLQLKAAIGTLAEADLVKVNQALH